MNESVPKKIPYIPSQEYRYELSEDEISRKRFRALMEMYKLLQRSIPEIPISFCMYGSLTKGKVLIPETAPNSDIDLEVLYDKEAPGITTSKNKIELINKLEFYIEETVLKRMEEIEDGSELGIMHFAVNPINHNSIWRAFMNLNGQPMEKQPIKISLRLALYFTLSVGDAVKKYRDQFLKELTTIKSTGDEGEAEKIWDKIKKCVEQVERQGQIPEKTRKQFPQTIEEALKFYEVE